MFSGRILKSEAERTMRWSQQTGSRNSLGGSLYSERKGERPGVPFPVNREKVRLAHQSLAIHTRHHERQKHMEVVAV